MRRLQGATPTKYHASYGDGRRAGNYHDDEGRLFGRCKQEKEAKEKRREQARKDMERVSRLRKASLMDEKFKEARFATFQITKYNSRNLKLCQRYVSGFDEMMAKNQGLIFWGDVGTGKSYAAACIANELLSKGVPVVMTSLVKILELVQAGDEKESDIISRLKSARLVIFDDLGAERSTDYALEKIYNIIDSRYRSKEPMLLTTNQYHCIQNFGGKRRQTRGSRRWRRCSEAMMEVVCNGGKPPGILLEDCQPVGPCDGRIHPLCQRVQCAACPLQEKRPEL